MDLRFPAANSIHIDLARLHCHVIESVIDLFQQSERCRILEDGCSRLENSLFVCACLMTFDLHPIRCIPRISRIITSSTNSSLSESLHLSRIHTSSKHVIQFDLKRSHLVACIVQSQTFLQIRKRSQMLFQRFHADLSDISTLIGLHPFLKILFCFRW